MSISKDLNAWPQLFVTFNRIHQKMEEAMKELGHPPLETYDVLWTLERAEHHALRFSDLGERVLLSRSNVTRLAERLETQGLIERSRCPSDRRGVFAVLTKEGQKLRKAMWQDYAKLIEENFSLHLTEKDHADLIRILRKVWQEPEHAGSVKCPNA